jgi:hypothetical protein
MKDKTTIKDNIVYSVNWIRFFIGSAITLLGLTICGIKKTPENFIEQIDNLFNI